MIYEIAQIAEANVSTTFWAEGPKKTPMTPANAIIRFDGRAATVRCPR